MSCEALKNCVIQCLNFLVLFETWKKFNANIQYYLILKKTSQSMPLLIYMMVSIMYYGSWRLYVSLNWVIYLKIIYVIQWSREPQGIYSITTANTGVVHDPIVWTIFGWRNRFIILIYNLVAKHFILQCRQKKRYACENVWESII